MICLGFITIVATGLVLQAFFLVRKGRPYL